LYPAQEKGIIVFAVDREGAPGAERFIQKGKKDFSHKGAKTLRSQ
jgi:hypothetical protein